MDVPLAYAGPIDIYLSSSVVLCGILGPRSKQHGQATNKYPRAPPPKPPLHPLAHHRHLLLHHQLEAEDFARRWQMLGNASKEEAAEVWGGVPVTAERWSEIRGIVTSALKMGTV